MKNAFITTDKDASDRRKLVSKWHVTTKGTLRRNYRVPSKSEGRRLLKAVASLLSEDDHFTDATSHKVTDRIIILKCTAVNGIAVKISFHFIPLVGSDLFGR